MNIKTRLTYDESILKNTDVLKIVAKCEKLAVKYFLDDNTTARIDPEGCLFFDIRLLIRKCNLRDDTKYMNLEFQFVPSDKYFNYRNWESIRDNYPAEGQDFFDTSLVYVLGLCENSGMFSSWESVKSYLDMVQKVARNESVTKGIE